MNETDRPKDLPCQEGGAATPAKRMPRLGEIFVSFLRLGSVSFGILISPERCHTESGRKRRVLGFDFPPCLDCGGCDNVEANIEDCFGNPHPTCGDCLWSRGIVICP